jgi:hypothetical protein
LILHLYYSYWHCNIAIKNYDLQKICHATTCECA